MSTIIVELDSETEGRLRKRADDRGESLEAFLRHIAEREADDAVAADMLAEGIAWLTNRTPAEVQAARERILAATPPARELPPGMTFADAVVGKWPGTETDAEIQEALEKLS